MHLSTDHDDRRPAQRRRVHLALDLLVEILERDTPPYVVLGGLVAAARKLEERLEQDREPAYRGRARR